MKAEIHQLRPKPVAVNWMCSACGVDAGCNCGAPLMSKAQRAADAVAASPQKSDRAIAREIGVDHKTVGAARNNLTGEDSPVREPRVGLDGKARRMPIRPVIEDDDGDDSGFEPATPSEVRMSFLICANEAMLLAKYDGPINAEIIDATRATASAWSRLLSTMEQGK